MECGNLGYGAITQAPHDHVDERWGWVFSAAAVGLCALGAVGGSASGKTIFNSLQ